MAERRLPWLGAAGSVALASFIAFGGVRLYRAQLAETLDSRGTEIAAIAELKIWELLRWRLDRTADARTAADTLAVLSAGQSERAPGGASREPLTALLESLRRHQTIEAAAIVEPSGKVLLSVGIAPGDLEAVCRELLAKREPVVDTVFRAAGSTAATAANSRIDAVRTRTDNIASFISRASIFLPRYSGVRPTIRPATNTATNAMTIMP